MNLFTSDKNDTFIAIAMLVFDIQLVEVQQYHRVAVKNFYFGNITDPSYLSILERLTPDRGYDVLKQVETLLNSLHQERIDRERLLRIGWGTAYAGHMLYADDGCLQDCRESPIIDFLSDDPQTIREKITQRAANTRNKETT